MPQILSHMELPSSVNPANEAPNHALGNTAYNTAPANQSPVSDESASMNQEHAIHSNITILKVGVSIVVKQVKK